MASFALFNFEFEPIQNKLRRAEPNAPVKDYICEKCKAQYLIMYNTQINKE